MVIDNYVIKDSTNLSKGLSRQELRALFQAKIRKIVSPAITISGDEMQQLENRLGGVEEVGTLLQEGIDYLRENPQHSRRTFLKAAVTGGLGFALLPYVSFPQRAEAMGCAPALKETRQDVERIDLDCNPILPLPDKGCYTGTNKQVFSVGYRREIHSGGRVHFVPYSIPAAEKEKDIIEGFVKAYGTTPTFHAFGSGLYAAANASFPREACQAAIDLRVIPVIIYVIMPFEGYKPIIKDKHDDDIREFANQAAEFEHPIVLVPFQLPNQRNRNVYEWGAYPAGQYKEAWVHMYELFEREGANKNTVWSLKLASFHPTHGHPDPFPYIPPEQYFDLIGWQTNNYEIHGQFSQSLKSLFDYNYKRAARKYPRKPQIIWELSSAYGPYQDEWLDKALTLIKEKYFSVKGVSFDENCSSSGSFRYKPIPTNESIQVIKKHFTDPYYIGSIIKK